MPKTGSAAKTPRPPSIPRPPTLPKSAVPGGKPVAKGLEEGEAATVAAGKSPPPSSSPHSNSLKVEHLPCPPSKPHPSKVSGNGNDIAKAVAGDGHAPNGKRPRDVGDGVVVTSVGYGHSPPKRSREVDGGSVARAAVPKPGSGERVEAAGRGNGNGVRAAFNGSTTPGVIMKHALHATTGFPRQEARTNHEKRPRDEGFDGGSGDPGSGGKKSRVNGYGMEFDAGVGDLESASSTGSVASPRTSVLEDGEVEDGEISMAALGAVSAV